MDVFSTIQYLLAKSKEKSIIIADIKGDAVEQPHEWIVTIGKYIQ